MPVFLYTGRGAGSKSVNGEIDATDKQEAMAKLRQRRVVVSELRTKPKDIKVGGLGGGVGVKDLKIFARLFGTMINAGLPIGRPHFTVTAFAISPIATTTPGVLPGVAACLMAGAISFANCKPSCRTYRCMWFHMKKTAPPVCLAARSISGSA